MKDYRTITVRTITGVARAYVCCLTEDEYLERRSEMLEKSLAAPSPLRR